MKKPLITAALGIGIFLTGCPAPLGGIIETCEQFNKFRECQAMATGKLVTPLECQLLSKKFEGACTQLDVDYAREAFKQDAERICALVKDGREIDQSQLKTSFDLKRISTSCIHAPGDEELGFYFNDDI